MVGIGKDSKAFDKDMVLDESKVFQEDEDEDDVVI